MRTSLVAWLLVGVVALPTVIASVAFDAEPSSGRGQMASLILLGGLLLATRRSAALAPFRGFISVWIAYLLAAAGMHLTLDAVGLVDWTDRTPKYRWITLVSALILVPSLVMLAAARMLGLTRSDLNLVRGDLGARGNVPGTQRMVSWRWIGPTSVVAIVAIASVTILLVVDATTTGLERLATWLPLGIVFAIVNPIQEEIRFRLVPLATLVPNVGTDSAIWMTATIFALAHWSGAHPSGPLGLVLHGFGGLWLAKSIVETRGVAWAWIIHASGNLALFVFLALDAG